MAREINAGVGTAYPSDLFNRQQETSSGEAWGITLVKLDANTVAVQPAIDGSGGGSAGLRINGKARYLQSQVTLDIAGGAGTKSVYALAGVGPGFTLATSASGDSRKIGEVDWDGAAITAVRTMVDAVSGHGWQHRHGGPDPIPPLQIVSVLPDSPFDGQEIRFQDATMAARGVIWTLRFRSGASGSYKWEFIGGPPMVYTWFGSNSGGSSTATAFGSLQPSVPLAGDYCVTADVAAAHYIGSTSEEADVLAGLTTAAPGSVDDVDGFTPPDSIFRVSHSYSYGLGAGNAMPINGSRSAVLTAIPAGGQVCFWRRVPFGAILFRALTLSLLPRRVG